MNLTLTTGHIIHLYGCYMEYKEHHAHEGYAGSGRLTTDTILRNAHQRIAAAWKNGTEPDLYHTITVTRNQWLRLQEAVTEATEKYPSSSLTPAFLALQQALAAYRLAAYVEEAETNTQVVR